MEFRYRLTYIEHPISLNMVDCKSIEEVREKIDRIDREIVELISQRSSYVGQAAKFKKTTQDVKPLRVSRK